MGRKIEMASLGFWIFMSMVLYVDYKIFIRSGDAIFFKDKSQIEKDLREIQRIEVRQKLEKLKKEEE